IDDEQHQVGTRHGLADLKLNVLGQRGEIGADVVEPAAFLDVNAEAAGVGDLDGDFVAGVRAFIGRDQVGDDAHAVAGGTRGRVHDGDLVPRDHVEEGRLADVRPADDGDAGNGHPRV